jgi:hypothetical protein
MIDFAVLILTFLHFYCSEERIRLCYNTNTASFLLVCCLANIFSLDISNLFRN